MYQLRTLQDIANPKPIAVQDPLQQFGALSQVQNTLRSGQLQDEQIAAVRRGVQADSAVTAVLQDAKMDETGAIDAATRQKLQRINSPHAIEILKHFDSNIAESTRLKNDTMQAEAQKKNADTNAAKLLSTDSANAAKLRGMQLKVGPDGDYLPIDESDLTPQERAKRDKDAAAASAYEGVNQLRAAQQDLAQATADLRRLQADPNSPQYELARQRLAVAQRNSDIAAQGLGVRQQNTDLRAQNMDIQNFGGYAKSAVFLDSVSELADKINTSEGVYAKAKGTAREQAAKLNYDDDVAEYEAMVQSFTPLWARALGHTGVLTQQDVDSARMALPAPGDSKSLKDRKLARIQKILGGEIKATEEVSGRQNPQVRTASPSSVLPGGITLEDIAREKARRAGKK